MRHQTSVLSREYGKKIVNFLKGQKSAEGSAKERQFRYLVRKGGFKMMKKNCLDHNLVEIEEKGEDNNDDGEDEDYIRKLSHGTLD